MSWLIEKLRQQFNHKNNAPCLCIDDVHYSFSFMAEKIAAIQTILTKNSTQNIVGILAENKPETYASMLACWFSGKGFVPIHPKYPVDRNKDIIRQTAIDLILTSDATIEETEYYGVKAVNTEGPVHVLSGIKVEKTDPDRIFCILFTSGSTGQPKGVPMSLRNIEVTMDSFFSLGYELNKNDKFLQMFELTFDMSMLSWLTAFLTGAEVFTVGADKIRYLEALRIMQKYGITFAAMVPSTLLLSRQYLPRISLPALRYSLLGGEPFQDDLAKSWSQCVPNALIVNISGPSEITMACMGYNLSKDFSKNKTHNGILAFGYPWKNTLAIVVDENLETIEDEMVGELCFAGEHVIRGYLNRDDLNKQVFFEKTVNGKKQRFYRTGDMTYRDSKGLYFTCGRSDLQVKVMGHKVELEEVEYIARKITGVPETYAIAQLNNSGVTEISMVIRTEAKVNSIMEKLRQQLPDYMIPAHLRCVGELPYNANGKIDRPGLKELFL